MADEKLNKNRMREVKSILISQPQPDSNEKSPYTELATKYGIKIDFKPFIQVEPLPAKEFRKQKIGILDHTAIVFTSKNAIDFFFKLCEEMKIEMPPEMKYFCITEQQSNYLQKYIVIRKRKIFHGVRTAADLTELIKKHKTEKFLYPCSEIRRDEIPLYMAKNNIKCSEAIIYRTVASNLSDINLTAYDMIGFFSPSGVHSLFTNFPDFQQGDMRIAAFGPTTAKAVTEHNLILDIQAPQPNAPSMTGAIELYIKEANKLKS
ncbi:MAG: uroporphyrinogen-III synthase [Thermoflexibacter sp.]|jgi:uroporphyrinogen-III synthase|nr:uroporphyrinogen-III synthase [Thermoflexibacter sp.]